MHEIDFLPVGDGKDSGDAIAFRFLHPEDGRWVHVIVDAGFADDGHGLVDHVKTYYGTDEIDLAILTHPDGDHIGGMGNVVRGLKVRELWVHDLGAHGGSSLPAANAVTSLIAIARERGTKVSEPWAATTHFGGALTILGPDRGYYDQLVQDQLGSASSRTGIGSSIAEAARSAWDRVVAALGVEVPFEAREVTPRNNTSIITLLKVDNETSLLTADAGVPALERAWDVAEGLGLAKAPDFVQIPHHGSRRNASSALLDRILGPTGQADSRTAFISVAKKSEKHPSGRVVNAHLRRGCNITLTTEGAISHRNGTPRRPGWGPARLLGPMEEEAE